MLLMPESAPEEAPPPEQAIAAALALAEELVPELLSPRRALALDRMEQAYEQLTVALSAFIACDDVERAARLIRALRSYWQERHLVPEGQQWTARALGMPSAAARTASRATLLDQAAMLAVSAGDYDAARALLGECLTLRREVGPAGLVPNTLTHLALILRTADHDYQRARSLLEEALALAREQGTTYIHRAALYRLAQVAIDQGDWTTAREALEENVAVARATGDEWALGLVLELFAVLAAQQGQAARALRLAGAGAAHRPGIGRGGQAQPWLERLLTPARQTLDETAQAAAWNAGHAMNLEQALDDALSTEAA